MKISDFGRTSRSNSLPVTPGSCRPPMDDTKASDYISHFSVTTLTHPTANRISRRRSRGANDDEAARKRLNPIQDSPYVSIQVVDTSLISEEIKPASIEEPPAVRGKRALASYAISVAQRGRLLAKCQKNRRLVHKNGRSNVTMTKLDKKGRRFISDMFTTLMDLKWRYHVLLFISVFLTSWLVFGVSWLALAYFNGDMTRKPGDNSTNLCLSNVYDFSTALLYSLETQTTIGYGYRVIGPDCPMGTGLLMTQSCVGIFVQCFITGIVFAKIARPKRRAQTIVFSNHAVVCMRDGFYNLIFRMGDLRKTHIIGTSIRALLVKSRRTTEGEVIPLCQYPLILVTESNMTDSFVSFFWPVTIAHRITPSSPLWDLSADTLLSQHFEIIVILEGTVQTSGSLIQIRTSYIPKEIKWGQRLTPLATHIRDYDECEIDFSNFHDTSPIVMPDCSAEDYSKRMNINQQDPVDNDYRCSFTSPSVLCNDGSSSIRRNVKNARLPRLARGSGIGLRIIKSTACEKKSTKAEEKAEEMRLEMKELSAVFSSSSGSNNAAALTPPPMYASCAAGNPLNLELDPLAIRTSATIHDESRGITAPEGSPGWLRYGAQVNRAFNTSMT